MNEIFFLSHVGIVSVFLFFCLRLGKGALIALMILSSVLANLFIVKQITLFSFQVTASDVFAVSTIWGMNLLQEFYGKKEATKATYISFLMLLFFTLMAKLHLMYLPNHFDLSQDAFRKILSQTPRIVISSFIVFFIVQRIDIQIFSWLSKKIKNKLSLRVALSLSCSQFIDTVLFTFLALFGVVGSVWQVIFISYMIKMSVIVASLAITPLLKPKKVSSYEAV